MTSHVAPTLNTDDLDDLIDLLDRMVDGEPTNPDVMLWAPVIVKLRAMRQLAANRPSRLFDAHPFIELERAAWARSRERVLGAQGVIQALQVAQEQAFATLTTQLEAARARELDLCVWTYDDRFDEAKWETGCGTAFVFFEDGPEENHAHFCHQCGKRIKAVRPALEEDV